MVRTTEKFTAPPTTAAIVGGFVSIPVGHILAVWFACQGIDLGIGEFRAWLACIEMVKRRTFARQGAPASYGFAELARLLGVTQRRARLLVQNLVDAGLITWSDSAITFPAPTPIPDELLGPFADTIGRGKGDLVIPRRLIRFLARGGTPAIIAVALAAFFRCLSCRGGQPDGWGRLKISWIATAFRIGERQVDDARKELVNLGWLIVEGDNRQRVMNRHGKAYRINLCWKPPARPGARSAPPSPTSVAHSAPPLLDRSPLREESKCKNQNPASGGPAGVQLPEGEAETEIPEIARPPVAARPMILPAPPAPVVLPSPASAQTPTPAMTFTSLAMESPAVSPAARPSATAGPCPAISAPVALPAARLDDVRVEDLKDTGRLMDLLGQAVARGLVGESEADRLRFVGAAEHALEIGKENPAGLFASLVRRKLWNYLTQDDETGASVRIREFLRGPGRSGVAPVGQLRPSGPSLSADARMVREIREAFIRAGVFRDPFPELHRRQPEWSRERWDAALAELGT